MRDRQDVERIARNEVLFRRVNEAIDLDDADPGDVLSFVCECGRLGCTETVGLSRREYDAVRIDFDRFLLVPGHEQTIAERVIEDHGRYLVVAKRGSAREVAAEDAAREDTGRADEVAGP